MPTELTLNGPRNKGGPRIIPRAIVDHLGGEMAFSDAVVRYREAKAAHALTDNETIGAPIAHPLVEEVVNRYGAAFEIEEPPDPEPKGKPFLAEDQDRLIRLDGDSKIFADRLAELDKKIFQALEVSREIGRVIEALRDELANTRANTQEQIRRLSEQLEAITPARV